MFPSVTVTCRTGEQQLQVDLLNKSHLILSFTGSNSSRSELCTQELTWSLTQVIYSLVSDIHVCSHCEIFLYFTRWFIYSERFRLESEALSELLVFKSSNFLIICKVIWKYHIFSMWSQTPGLLYKLCLPLPNISRASQTPGVHPPPPLPSFSPSGPPSCCHLCLETFPQSFIPLLAISLSTLSHHPTVPPIAPLIVSLQTSPPPHSSFSPAQCVKWISPEKYFPSAGRRRLTRVFCLVQHVEGVCDCLAVCWGNEESAVWVVLSCEASLHSEACSNSWISSCRWVKLFFLYLDQFGNSWRKPGSNL